MNEERTGSVYDKRNIAVVICDTDNGQPRQNVHSV